MSATTESDSSDNSKANKSLNVKAAEFVPKAYNLNATSKPYTPQAQVAPAAHMGYHYPTPQEIYFAQQQQAYFMQHQHQQMYYPQQQQQYAGAVQYGYQQPYIVPQGSKVVAAATDVASQDTTDKPVVAESSAATVEAEASTAAPVPGEAKATVVLPDDEVDPTISFIAPIDTELAAPPGLQEKPVAASATQERVDMAPVAEKHEPLESKSVDPKPDADPKPAKKASFDRGAKPPGLPVDDKGGWRREKPVVALSVQKYSKEEIVAMFERGVHQIPEALRAWYPDAKEQGPLASTPRGSGSTGANTSARGGGSGVRRVGGSGGSAGAAASSRYNTPPPPPLSAEELAMFDPNKENVFKYQPTLLSDTADPEVVVKKANLLLNKLSLDKFDKLSREFMDVGIEDPAIMNRSVDLIVSKAQMEEHFSSMYAELCRKIHDEWTAKSEGREVDTGKMFRDLLLSRCEDEFATNWVAKLSVIRSSDMGEEDKVEKEILLKRKYTGHMIFIGEIYLKDMVRAAIMRNCINELMESNEEEHWTCMCKLMQTIGKKYDEYCVSKKKTYMKTFFEKISEVSDDHAYSSRMRFMLKDLMDLRKCGWQSRRETEKAKKLSEIRSGGGESKTAAVAPPKPQDARNIRTAEPAADEWVTVTSSRRGSASSAPKSPVKEAVKASASKASSSMFGALGKETKKPSDKSKVKMESKTKKEPSRATPDIDVAPSPSPEDDENDDASPEAQEGTESAEDANVPELPGADGHLEKEDLRHVTNVVEEYFTNGLYSEALLSLRERVDPRGMGDVVRGLIVFVLEKKDEQRRKVATLLVDLYNDDFLTAETATAGVMSFLDVFEDLCIDVPRAGDYAAVVIGALMANDIVPLSVFCSLPEESTFSAFYKSPELIIHSVKEMCSGEDGTSKAKAAYEAAEGLPQLLLANIATGPKQDPADALKELVAKVNIPFALSPQ